MPWCPICKIEYRDGFTVCSDCGSLLADECPEDSPEEIAPVEDASSYPALLTEAADMVEADIITGFLESEGIRSMKRHQASGGYMQIYMGATVFGIEIYVPCEDLERAEELLMAYFASNELSVHDSEVRQKRYKVTKISKDIGKGHILREPKDGGKSFDGRRKIVRIVILIILIPTLTVFLFSGIASIWNLFTMWSWWW